jgi:pseudouridine synthase
LILLTNDGELVHRLTHPSFEVEKVYVAEVAGVLGRTALQSLTKEGVRIEQGRPAKAIKARALDVRRGGGGRSVIELTLHEGRKHVVRRMLEAVGHPVKKLTRTSVGPISLGRLKPGDYRALSSSEVASLYRAVGL